MKKLLFWGFIPIALAVLVGCASTGGSGDGLSLGEVIEQSAMEITAKLPGNTRVAIVAFDSEHENVSNYIMDELTGALVDGAQPGSGLEVADRRNLEFVYKELGFQVSGDVDDKTAVSIGKFLGAKYVVTGQLIKAGTSYRYRLSGINVETAVQESSTRLNVRDDRNLRSLLADLRKNSGVTAAASYGKGQADVQPTTAGAFLDRGILFATRGDFDMAIDEFTEAIALDGKLAAAYLLRGRTLKASAVHVTDIGENFSGVSTISTAGQITETQRQAIDRAIGDFSQAIKLDTNNKTAYLERGRAYEDKGDYDRAIADFTQVIKLDPNGAFAYTLRGSSYDYKGDQDRAIADYNQAIRLNPNYGSAYYNRANAYGNKGDHDRAIADYNQAIKLDPNYADAYNNRGIAYVNKGDYDRAIADYNQAIKLDPNCAAAYNNRGVVYYKKDDYARARADWNKALQLDPNNTNARDNLEELGNRGK